MLQPKDGTPLTVFCCRAIQSVCWLIKKHVLSGMWCLLNVEPFLFCNHLLGTDSLSALQKALVKRMNNWCQWCHWLVKEKHIPLYGPCWPIRAGPQGVKKQSNKPGGVTQGAADLSLLIRFTLYNSRCCYDGVGKAWMPWWNAETCLDLKGWLVCMKALCTNSLWQLKQVT